MWEPRSRSAGGGFTLLEIIIAVAIIVVIVSIVYGSYFATARSTEAYEATTELSAKVRQALAQMARQIRCAYVPQSAYKVEQMPLSSATLGQPRYQEELIPQDKSVVKDAPDYFSGGVDGPAGEVLHLVTTDSSCSEPDSTNGLFEVTYRFDKSSGVMSLSQQRFIERPDSAADHTNWQPVLTGVKRIELTFYDGQEWLHKWDFKDKRRPPAAVKVDITCQDKSYRNYSCATTAHVACHKNQGKKMAVDTLISADEQ